MILLQERNLNKPVIMEDSNPADQIEYVKVHFSFISLSNNVAYKKIVLVPQLILNRFCWLLITFPNSEKFFQFSLFSKILADSPEFEHFLFYSHIFFSYLFNKFFQKLIFFYCWNILLPGSQNIFRGQPNILIKNRF